MTHPVVINFPEKVFRPLANEAEAKGQTFEEIVVERLTPDSTDDPFAKFLGFFDSGGMDWGNRHDEYIGENLARESTGEME